jgi:hypothetical protein
MVAITPRQQANRDQFAATVRDLLDQLIAAAAGAPDDRARNAVLITRATMDVPQIMHGDGRLLTDMLLAEAVARLAERQ